MPYDFRPYMRATKPASGQPGRGIFLPLSGMYMFPDHGNILVPATGQLEGINQPFADGYQGLEIWAQIMRLMWKKAKKSEAMQASIASNSP